MEHEIEKLIREKVRAAEGMNVSWNKERVWDNLVMSPPRKYPPSFFYGVAAGFVLLLASSLVVVTAIDRKNEKETILALENKIHLKLSAAEKDKGIFKRQEPKSVPCGSPDHRNIALVVKKEHRRLAEFGNPVSPEGRKIEQIKQPLPNLNTEVLAEIPAVVLGEHVLPVETKQEKVIAAIVGIIPSPEVVVRDKKRKKLKIEINSSPDKNSVAAAAEEHRSFTARLN